MHVGKISQEGPLNVDSNLNSCPCYYEIIIVYVLFYLPPIDEENMNPLSVRAYHPRGDDDDDDDELSTLPSPSSSVVDLDSNAGTVETEVLLSSYKGSHTSASGT